MIWRVSAHGVWHAIHVDHVVHVIHVEHLLPPRFGSSGSSFSYYSDKPATVYGYLPPNLGNVLYREAKQPVSPCLTFLEEANTELCGSVPV